MSKTIPTNLTERAHVIEHSVSIDKLIESNRALRTLPGEAPTPVESTVGHKQAQAFVLETNYHKQRSSHD
jgi:hypothetical protein